MIAATPEQIIQTFRIDKELVIRAPIDLAFEALLEEIGPEGEGAPGTKMPMVLEAWPGGRWFRDLGDNAGHLWGHVQVIKPPALLEISGPLFMSYAAANHLQWKLKAEGTSTRLSFVHRAMGEIDPEHRKGVDMGWADWLERTRKRGEAKAAR
jgi:hypothetical protein